MSIAPSAEERARIGPQAMKKKRAAGTSPEYRLDYSKSKPNRFAAEVAYGSVAVILAPDVASVFDSSESVNRILRSVIAAFRDAHPKK
jgi:hypothetical protein